MRYSLDPLSPTGISKEAEKPSFRPYFAGGPGKPSLLDSINGKHGAVQITAGDNVTIDNTEKDIIEISSTGGGGGASVSDTAYASSWNGVTTDAPSKNAVYDKIETLAPLASPTFTGTPAAPTAASNTNTTQIATTAFVQTELAELINSAPGALDTLDELAAALGDDANFATTVTNSLAGKQAKAYIVVGPTGDLGYITDGTADDVQIQAAIDDVNTAGGGTVFIQEATYAIATTIGVKSNVTIVGADKNSTILRVNNSANISVFSTATEGLSHITLRNLTIDQNGANQSSGGGGFTIDKVSDLTIDNCRFKASYNFQVLIGSGTGTALSGTLTFTLNDATVSGSSTAFTTELAEGSIIKTNGGKFVRVASIASNTSLELDRQFEYTTEAGVAATSYTGNLRIRLTNNDFEGSANTDNVGLGLLVGGLIQGNTSFGSGGGYGFGPDHCFETRFIGNRSYNNSNDGIGMETCSYCIVANNQCYNSTSGNGIRLLSGSYRNTIIGNICKNNVNGINVTYNSTSFGKPDGNQIIGNTCELNSTHGIRIGGSSRNIIVGNKSMNNGSHGISLATDNAITPDANSIQNNYCHDSQDAKTQTHGISIGSGTSNVVLNNHSLTADHVTAGFTDSGTSTQIFETGSIAYKSGKFGVGTLAPATVGHFYEDTTATGTSAGVTIEQDGATGDAVLQFLLSGVRRWVTGIDNSDSDKFKISPVTDLANAVFEITTAGVAAFSGDVSVPDEAYGAGWNGSLEVPTKNAVYDKIETVTGGGVSESLAIAYAVAL